MFATHNRAGEITYKHISGFTYQITVRTYTKISAPADRPWLPIFWGDGTPRDSLERTGNVFYNDRDAKMNFYTKVHTYPGPGLYKICVSDPNRNGGVLNIVNSIQVQFSIQTILIVTPAVAANNSVDLTNIPLQDACFQQPWIYNPGAVDMDGDSIAYSLVTPQGVDCMELTESVYSLPDRIPLNQFPNPDNQISIDPVSGTVTWDSPQLLGEYNIAILIKEYRNGIFIGSVLRDMQILVKVCDNLPPEIDPVPDKCVTAGTGISFPVTATDPDGNNVLITGFGAPFNLPSSPASLSQSGQLPPVTAQFNWNTNCSHVRLQPYQVTFQATDNGAEVSLVDITTMNITVVAPAPENLLAMPIGSSIALSWSPTICNNALGYRLYRRVDPFGFVPGPCETGVPAYTGYGLIAEIPGVNNVTYLDEDEIVFGRQNCYLVIAYFADGSESYAGAEACAEILFEIPIIKKNSIGVTGINGVDTVAWRAPAKLDPEVFPGPYKFRLLRGEGYGATTELVLETEENADIEALPTSFISTGLNTEATAHTYRVELFSGGTFASRSNRASSLFLVPVPDDNQINLTWEKQAPWANFRYDIYRQAQGETEFILIGSTTEVSYLDTGLVNNLSYCYYIISYGSYFSVLESDTLINFSQQACAQPYDRTPPCPPVLTAIDDCEALTVDLNWTNPNIACDETDDTMMYHIYFAPEEDGEFELIEVVNGAEITEFFLELENSIAGCYAVTALDSLSLWPDGELVRNESEFSNIVCVDNCPVYSLPNVFTPNGDGVNDILLAFPYRAVEYVEFTLFNRWGSIVFETTDPDIKWDGRNKETGELVTSSTYFYVCNVFTIRLEGLVPLSLTGNITVFSSVEKRLE
jgi:gliding motility-associated-like protein